LLASLAQKKERRMEKEREKDNNGNPIEFPSTMDLKTTYSGNRSLEKN